MKILNEIKSGFKNFNKRAAVIMIIGLLISAILFVISIGLYLYGGVREQNMLTYFASLLGEYAFSVLFIGLIASFFVDIIEKSAENKK